jgi:hypothetical protein
MNSSPGTRTRPLVLAAALAIMLAACTGVAAGVPSAPTAAPTVAQTPTARPAPTPIAVRLTETDNGHTVSVPLGSTVTLVLRSTYWQVQGSSSAGILSLASGPDTSAPPMGTCVPGAGCGTVTAAFHAIAAGRASITASRTTCGEAMLCSGTAGAYAVTIVVVGG